MPRLDRGDEGRSKAAISLGELPSKLRSEDFRMRKLTWRRVMYSDASRRLQDLSSGYILETHYVNSENVIIRKAYVCKARKNRSMNILFSGFLINFFAFIHIF